LFFVSLLGIGKNPGRTSQQALVLSSPQGFFVGMAIAFQHVTNAGFSPYCFSDLYFKNTWLETLFLY